MLGCFTVDGGDARLCGKRRVICSSVSVRLLTRFCGTGSLSDRNKSTAVSTAQAHLLLVQLWLLGELATS